MEALKILRKHIEKHYLFSNKISSEQLVDFRKSLVSAMEEYAELCLSNVVKQSEQCAHTSADIRTLRCNCCNECGEIIDVLD